MARPNASWPQRYSGAVLSTAAALLLALLFTSEAGRGPSGLFLAAVMLSTWYGGLGPGLLATLLGGAALDYWFERPKHTLAITDLGTALDLLVFVLVALLISSLHA